MTIEPTRIYSPGEYIPPPSNTPPIYDTYNTRTSMPPGTQTYPPKSNTVRSKLYSPPANSNVRVPSGVPSFLGNRAIIFNAWLVSMLLVGYDEWHNLGIFPRPARLWKTTEVFGLLYLFSLVDALTPLANAFAIGLVITLLWQYYNGGITPSGATDNSSVSAFTSGNLTPGDNATQIGAGLVPSSAAGTG